jgi:hypothetical protein
MRSSFFLRGLKIVHMFNSLSRDGIHERKKRLLQEWDVGNRMLDELYVQ